MKKEFYIGTVTFVLVIALIYMPTGYAQNLTTNASSAMGNLSEKANQTGGNIMNKTGEALGNLGEKIQEGIGAK